MPVTATGPGMRHRRHRPHGQAGALLHAHPHPGPTHPGSAPWHCLPPGAAEPVARRASDRRQGRRGAGTGNPAASGAPWWGRAGAEGTAGPTLLSLLPQPRGFATPGAPPTACDHPQRLAVGATRGLEPSPQASPPDRQTDRQPTGQWTSNDAFLHVGSTKMVLCEVGPAAALPSYLKRHELQVCTAHLEDLIF